MFVAPELCVNVSKGIDVSDKFKNVPIDPDTDILFYKITKIDKYDVLYQIWNWDGIRSESIIFEDNDVKGLSEDAIKEIVKTSSLLKGKESSMTFSQSGSGYTFVNFNFEQD